jgi:aspartate racemase
MHLMADEVEKAARIPLLHIADPLGAKIRADGKKRVGLLGSTLPNRDGDQLRFRAK